MSGVTHSQIPIKQRLRRDQRRAKIIALVAVSIFTALLIALMLVLAGDDSPTSGMEESAPQATHEPSAPRDGPDPAADSLSPGTRHDGGPEEGTRGADQ
jgi:hypothetical protein